MNTDDDPPFLCADDDPDADGVIVLRVSDALRLSVDEARSQVRQAVDELLDEAGETNPVRRAAFHAKAAAQLAERYEPMLHAQAHRIRLQIAGNCPIH